MKLTTTEGPGLWIEWALLLFILIAVIYAQIDGRFIHNTTTIVQVCNNVVENVTYLGFNIS